MRVLITGGTGFAGSHLAEHLLGQGQDVVLLARPEGNSGSAAHLRARARIATADLRDFDAVRAILDDIRPQRIFHLAAFSSVIESTRDPRHCYQVNLDGTLNLLDAWRQLGFDSRMLLVSSSNVYGVSTGVDLPLRETSPLRLENPYGGSKAASEFLAMQFGLSYGLPVIRARPFQHTGPRQSPAYVCSGLALRVAEIACGSRPPVLEVGNAQISRDFSDVRDIVRGYALLLEQGRAGEVYQLCSGRAVSVGAIIESLIAKTRASIEVRIDPAKARRGEATVLWGEPAKARSEAGWVAQYSLEETLDSLLAYWEDQIRNSTARDSKAGIHAGM
ncbi:MAG TPA: GDP-mannose 4,6-dehydratase [Terriglobia bacterium]|nr:GDP-mannose 4,6-dehydratase [Terriglobia bacterium]